MATVYFGRLVGPVGFSRIVALKRLHPQFAKDATLAVGLLDEARVASRIRHPNVVQVVDVVATDGELVLVLDYVHGESLAKLLRVAKKAALLPPPGVVSAIVGDVLRGLHAAHEAKSEMGQPLELVHRDISPQNILVHEDGMALVTDFGIARAVGRLQITTEDQLKGKPGYMAPEQVLGETMTRRTDIFAAGIVLWETLTGHRLFHAENNLALMRKLLDCRVDPPSRVRPGLPPAVNAVVLRALERSPEARFATAKEMLEALESALPPSPTAAVAEWARPLAQESLAKRAEQLRHIEAEPIDMDQAAFTAASMPPAPTIADFQQPLVMATEGFSPLGTSKGASLPGSQLSSEPLGVRTSPAMVLSSPDAPRSRNVPPLSLVLMAGAAIGVIFIGGFIWMHSASSPAPESVVPSSSNITQAMTSPSVAPITQPPVVEPVVASVSPAAPVSNTTRATTTTRPVSTRPTTPSNGCNPPYDVDARGIKVFKKQCLAAH